MELYLVSLRRTPLPPFSIITPVLLLLLDGLEHLGENNRRMVAADDILVMALLGIQVLNTTASVNVNEKVSQALMNF